MTNNNIKDPFGEENDIISDKLKRYVEAKEKEENGENVAYETFILDVLCALWNDVMIIKKQTESSYLNPSIIYLLRYETRKTLTSIFTMAAFLFLVFSFLGQIIGLEEIIQSIIP